MHPTLGNHEKHPKPFSCFIFGLPNHSHNTLGNHEKHPPPFSCSIFNNYSWEPWETPQPLFMLHFLHSETLPTPLLGAIKHPNPFSCFILAFPSPSHPLLGTMKHATLFSCFILGLPRPFPPPWSTQTLFHASFCAFPSPSHPTLGNREPLFDASDSSHPTLGNHEKHPPPFSCFIKGSGQVPQRSLSSTSGISNSRSFHPSHPTLGNHEPTTLFGTILHLPKPFPPHSWEPWSTQIPFHASFLAVLFQLAFTWTLAFVPPFSGMYIHIYTVYMIIYIYIYHGSQPAG